MTSPKCIRMTRWLVSLQDLIQDAYWQQDDPEIRKLIQEWKEEKVVLRIKLKGFYEQLFGHAQLIFGAPKQTRCNNLV